MTTEKKRNYLYVTTAQLVDVLRGVDSPQFCAGIFDTAVRMSKYDAYTIVIDGKKKRNPDAILNPYKEDGIRCVSKKFKLVTGFKYAYNVQKRREEEGLAPEFQQGDVWYNLVTKSLAVHKDDATKFYFRYQYLPKSIISADYYFKGDGIERMMFEKFKEDKSGAYANQGLTDALKVQVVDVNNIIELSLNGTTYIVIHSDSPEYRAKYIKESAEHDVEE